MEFFGPNGILYGLLAAAFVAFVAYIKSLGAKGERAKRDAAEARARDAADEVENDIGALTPDQRKERLKAWSKR